MEKSLKYLKFTLLLFSQVKSACRNFSRHFNKTSRHFFAEPANYTRTTIYLRKNIGEAKAQRGAQNIKIISIINMRCFTFIYDGIETCYTICDGIETNVEKSISIFTFVHVHEKRVNARQQSFGGKYIQAAGLRDASCNEWKRVIKALSASVYIVRSSEL